MDYSDEILDDNNIDYELDKLQSIVGDLNTNNWDDDVSEIYSELPAGFSYYENFKSDDGVLQQFGYWMKSGAGKMDVAQDNIGGGVTQVLVSGELAFKFKNVYLSLYFKDAL